MPSFDLPYFDQIIESLERQPDSGLAESFARHVHWGCYRWPEVADDSLPLYLEATEELTRRLCDAAGVADGARILDVGCGFGGTVDYLNQHLANCELVGLNVDARQLHRARKLVHARSGNRVSFVEGDACAPPFADGQFDVVLAIECIFHFSSRRRFFGEIRRVTKPGGALALTDFVLAPDALARIGDWMRSNATPESSFYGSNGIPPTAASYRRLGNSSGLVPRLDEDITAQTLPTYGAMRRLYRQAGLNDGVDSTNYLERLALRGFVQYHILAFDHGETDTQPRLRK